MLPVIRALAQRGAIVSVDTRHVEVAKAAVRVGASIVNDVTGFTDPKMLDFVTTNNSADCGGHARGRAYRARACAHRRAAGYLCRCFVAEKARAAAESAVAARKSRNTKRSLIQPLLPFDELPADIVPEKNDKKKPTKGKDAAAKDAEVSDAAETPSDAPSAEAIGAALAGSAIETTAAAVVADTAQPEPDALAAVMARSVHREEAYVSTSQLRRFTMPDSAPIMRRVMGFLSDQARALMQAGVARERICIDPGAGFGKTANEDIIIQRETAKMASLGYPLLCAVSRKRFVGTVSGVADATERDAATLCVLGRHPGWREHCARARRGRFRAVPQRLLGSCQASAAPGVRGPRLQSGPPLG